MRSVLRHITAYLAIAAALLSGGCRGDEVVIPEEHEGVGEVIADGPVSGFYLLNEGNMGSNKCSLDFYDYRTGVYSRNVYASRNPGVIKELGDVGNDLQIYRGKLYAVINCSHKVEVMDVATGIRVGQIDIPNCRYICFSDGKAYVSSYVGPVEISQHAPKGMVYEVDTESLAVTRRVTVGYQPEEMVIVDGKLYVANSGGYREPDYDTTVSVVDLSTFRQTRQIPVAINLHRLRADSRGRLWVSSRGNHGDIPSRLFMLERDEAEGEYAVSRQFDFPCSNLAINGDRLYYISTEWNDGTQSNSVSYGVLDLSTLRPLEESFVGDDLQRKIAVPYGLAVNPANGDIFLTDARNYVSSGTLYCISDVGKLKWSVRTGDIPASIAFVTTENVEMSE